MLFTDTFFLFFFLPAVLLVYYAAPAKARTVMFRDSFTMGLVPYLSEDFSRISYVWTEQFEEKTPRHGKTEAGHLGDRRTEVDGPPASPRGR